MFEFKIILHLSNLGLGWEFVLSGHSLLHVLQKRSNQALAVINFFLVLLLFNFKLLSKFIDFLLLLVKYFVVVSSVFGGVLFLHVLLNFLDCCFILVYYFIVLVNLLVQLLDLSIVLLHSGLQSFSGFWEGQVQVICLEFQVFLSLHQLNSFFLKMLCSLFQSISSKSRFSIGKAGIYVFKLVSGVIDVLNEGLVLFLQLFIVISLLWIQIIKSCFVLVLDFLNLSLELLDLSFSVPLLSEKVVQMGSLLVILVLNMHE